MTNANSAPNPPTHVFHIQIDRVHFQVPNATMTGVELRALPAPPIGPDRDLFEVIPSQPDKKVLDTDVVTIHDGQRFFTAPAHINPGRDWANLGGKADAPGL